MAAVAGERRGSHHGTATQTVNLHNEMLKDEERAKMLGSFPITICAAESTGIQRPFSTKNEVVGTVSTRGQDGRNGSNGQKGGNGHHGSSGANGSSGSDGGRGGDATGRAGNGQPGQDAEPGTNGRQITVTIGGEVSSVNIKGTHSDTVDCGPGVLCFTADGGDGGRGGDGGSGGNGGDGGNGGNGGDGRSVGQSRILHYDLIF